MQSPQVCANLWRFFDKDRIRLDLTGVFHLRLVYKPVDNVENSNYVNSYNNLQNYLCKPYNLIRTIIYYNDSSKKRLRINRSRFIIQFTSQEKHCAG